MWRVTSKWAFGPTPAKDSYRVLGSTAQTPWLFPSGADSCSSGQPLCRVAHLPLLDTVLRSNGTALVRWCTQHRRGEFSGGVHLWCKETDQIGLHPYTSCSILYHTTMRIYFWSKLLKDAKGEQSGSFLNLDLECHQLYRQFAWSCI